MHISLPRRSRNQEKRARGTVGGYRRRMANLIERHAQKIVGVLSYFDGLVLQGTLLSFGDGSGGERRRSSQPSGRR